MNARAPLSTAPAASNKARVFSRFFIPYLIVLSVPIVFGAFGVLRILGALETQYQQSEFVRFSHRTELVDQRVQELEATVTQIAFSSNVRLLLDRESPLEDGTIIPSLLDLQRDLHSLSLTNRFIANLAVTFRRSAVVTTEYHIFFGLPEYYGLYFRYGALTEQNWTTLILDRPHQREILPAHEVTLRVGDRDSVTDQMLCYLQTLPMDSYGVRGAIAVFIPERQILAELGWVATGDGTRYGVFDESGNAIAGDVAQSRFDEAAVHSVANGAQRTLTTVDGNSVYVFQVVSAATKWRYVEVVPARMFVGQIRDEIVVVLLSLAVAVMVGALLSYWAASYTARPIESAISMLAGREASGAAPAGNALDFLVKSVSQLVAHDDQFAKMVQEQEPLLKLAFLERLFTGGFKSDEEIRTYLHQTSLPEPVLPVRVLLVRIRQTGRPTSAPDLRRLNIAKALVKRQMQQEFRHPHYTYDVDFENIAVVIEQADWNSPDALLRSLEQTVKSGEGVRFALGIGDDAESLNHISRSYAEARMALQYRRFDAEAPVIRYSGIPQGGAASIPSGFSDRVANAVLSGNAADAAGLLDSFRRDNYLGRTPSLQTQHELDYALRDTLTKISHRLEKVDRAASEEIGRIAAAELSEGATVVDVFDEVGRAFELAGAVAERNRKSHNSDLRDAIVSYLERNFSDPGLYQQSVAEHFGISREYLSQFFREQTGTNFSAYLERLRIESAKHLMVASDIGVDEVARRSGYNSASALRRAFKRVEGIAPGSYRDAQR